MRRCGGGNATQPHTTRFRQQTIYPGTLGINLLILSWVDFIMMHNPMCSAEILASVRQLAVAPLEVPAVPMEVRPLYMHDANHSSCQSSTCGSRHVQNIDSRDQASSKLPSYRFSVLRLHPITADACAIIRQKWSVSVSNGQHTGFPRPQTLRQRNNCEFHEPTATVTTVWQTLFMLSNAFLDDNIDPRAV